MQLEESTICNCITCCLPCITICLVFEECCKKSFLGCLWLSTLPEYCFKNIKNHCNSVSPAENINNEYSINISETEECKDERIII